MAADRAQREQIVERQREIAAGDEQRGEHDVARVGGLRSACMTSLSSMSRRILNSTKTAIAMMVTLSATPIRLQPIF